jgi:hypothetical protein
LLLVVLEEVLKSSAKSTSSSWVQSVHCMPFCFCTVDVYDPING